MKDSDTSRFSDNFLMGGSLVKNTKKVNKGKKTIKQIRDKYRKRGTK